MRFVVGISGASGVEMSLTLLRILKSQNHETHLIMTDGAKLTWKFETKTSPEKLYELADYIYPSTDMGAVIASGSFLTDGLIIIPCSMKTLAGIVLGYADNLLLRVADVCLKESRKVVIVPREMPLGRIHLRNLSQAADLGCTIIPPMLTFYNHPQTIQDQIDHLVGKILAQFGLHSDDFRPWQPKESSL